MNGNRNLLFPGAAVLAIIFLAISQVASAAPTAAPADKPVVTPQQAGAIRAFAATALEKTAEARLATHKKDLPRAERVLSGVRPLLDMVQAYRPTAEVKALLHYIQTQMAIEDNKQTLPELLPLYKALNNMTPSPAVQKARARLDEAKQALETPDHGKALAALDAMDKQLVIDNIDLPLHAAQEDLNKAIKALQKNQAPDPDLLFSLEKNLLMLLL